MSTKQRTQTRRGKVFRFDEQLAKGNAGERWLEAHYHTPILQYKYHTADFIDWEGRLLELKSDNYSLQDTEFMFMERWSDADKRKPGGPWQSHGNGVDIFIYLFIRDGVYYEFKDMDALLERLKELTKGKRLIYIRNPGYRAGGYKVPIADLKDLAEEHKLYYSLDEV